MDFSIKKEDVVKALNFTLGVVEKRQTLPILSNVLLEVDESSLKLTATDLESEVSTTAIISNFKSGGKTTAQELEVYKKMDNVEIIMLNSYLDSPGEIMANNLEIKMEDLVLI